MAVSPRLLFKVNGQVVFTRDYVNVGLFSKKTIKAPTAGTITRVHVGIFGGSRTSTCAWRTATSCARSRSTTSSHRPTPAVLTTESFPHGSAQVGGLRYTVAGPSRR
jgi:hypothetical protein